MRTIVIARRVLGAPSAWARCDYINGIWEDGSMQIDRFNPSACLSQSNLSALLSVAIADMRGAELFLTPRLMTDIVVRGDPLDLDTPEDAHLDLFSPLGRPNAQHEKDIWVRTIIQPSAGVVRVLPDTKFVEKCLAAELRAFLTSADIEARNSQFDTRELWVRRSISAHMVCPSMVPAYVDKQPAAQTTELTPEQAAKAKARSMQVKRATRAGAEAAKFNADQAAAYGAKRRRELDAEAKSGKKTVKR
jgi:hypothetical protein